MKWIGIPVVTACIVALGACGKGTETRESQAPPASEQAGGTTTAAAAGAMRLLNDGANEVDIMRRDAALVKLLDRAKGVFLVPRYGQGAVVIGARGGAGVLEVRQSGGGWSNPVFYDIGGVSIGAQLGGAGGEIAMLLMTDKALNAFKGTVSFTVSSSTGYTIVDYNAPPRSWANSDIVMWSNMTGAFAGVSMGATDITYAAGRNRQYYGRPVTSQQILSGEVTSTLPDPVRQALSQLTPPSATTGTQMPSGTTGTQMPSGTTGTRMPGDSGM